MMYPRLLPMRDHSTVYYTSITLSHSVVHKSSQTPCCLVSMFTGWPGIVSKMENLPALEELEYLAEKYLKKAADTTDWVDHLKVWIYCRIDYINVILVVVFKLLNMYNLLSHQKHADVPLSGNSWDLWNRGREQEFEGNQLNLPSHWVITQNALANVVHERWTLGTNVVIRPQIVRMLIMYSIPHMKGNYNSNRAIHHKGDLPTSQDMGHHFICGNITYVSMVTII